MKRLAFVIVFLPFAFSAYELGMLHMPVPSPLDNLWLEFDMEHRFYGSVTDTFSDFLGLYDGANSYLGLEFAPIKGLQVSISRKSTQKEWTAGVSYSHRFPETFIRGRVGEL